MDLLYHRQLHQLTRSPLPFDSRNYNQYSESHLTLLKSPDFKSKSNLVMFAPNPSCPHSKPNNKVHGEPLPLREPKV